MIVADRVSGIDPRVVAAEAVDPIALYAAADEAGIEAALWLRPSEGFSLVGVGRAWAIEPEGPGRFTEAATEWTRVLQGTALGSDLPRGVGPVLLGGLGFSGRSPADDDVWAPFGAASLVLPEWILAQTAGDGGTWITTTTPDAGEGPSVRRRERLLARARELDHARSVPITAPPDAPLGVVAEQPDEGLWHRTVGLFAGAVGRGRIDKVVLARRVVLSAPAELDIERALRLLAEGAPESATFAFRRGGRTFLGATPERLIRTEGRAFRTAAIAGSVGRGRDAAADAELAAQLLASEKEREEHAVVVSVIRERLSPLSDDLRFEPEPRVLPLRTVQHLITEIDGTARERAGLLSLAERLHPTPAVGGEPRDIALGLVDEHEGFDRGWYAGPIGWLGADGDGELMVALRSGVVDRDQVTLFAGCGIVADSDPTREWEESRMKLRALASALGRPEEAP